MYVGGGHGDRTNNSIVMEYDISSGKWTKLPPYGAQGFAMTVINSQPVLVGGVGNGGCTSTGIIGVWRGKEWAHPYPEMPTARSECSAVVYNEWLVVAGGYEDGFLDTLSSVEVMNTDTKQLFAGPPTPTHWCSMKTAIVGDTCYFMGGSDNTGFYVNVVYSVSLPALLSQCSLDLRSSNRQNQIWKEIVLGTTCSTPLSIRGSLLAVGGQKGRKEVTAIQLYQPDTGKWVNVGDLPIPRRNCTCTMITDREMIVAGGDAHATAQMAIAVIGLLH